MGIQKIKHFIAVASGKGGTGDPSITIAKSLPDASIVIVTTPQKVALADVKKAISMFNKMGKSIAGIVENMSYFCCDHSEDRIEIFGKGGGEELSKETDLELLGELPIDIELRKGGDVGKPLMVDCAELETGKIFQAMAKSLLLKQPADNKFIRYKRRSSFRQVQPDKRFRGAVKMQLCKLTRLSGAVRRDKFNPVMASAGDEQLIQICVRCNA